MIDCGPLAGMSDADLQAALAKAQKAYVNLQCGSQAESLAYTQGGNQHQVTYTRANLSQLVQLIAQLRQALGLTTRTRRAIRPVFGR